MTARLSESAATGQHVPRVVSVSPMTARSLRPRDDDRPLGFIRPEADTQGLIQQDALALTQRAEHMIASLQSALDQAAMGDAQARDAVRSLQDRLRVGARMLQAFAAQITRIEQGIATMQQQRDMLEHAVQSDGLRLDDQAAAFEQRLEAAMEQFERRLAELGRTR